MHQNFSVGKFNEDVFNASFRPEYKALILKELEKNPIEKKIITKDIIFKQAFDPKFKEDIQRLLDILFDVAVDIGLCGDIDSIRVVFVRYSFWKLQRLSTGEQLKILPSLKVYKYRDEPAYTIILSDKELSSSDMMNIIRLLFSKIFGENFFKNQIENKSPFSELLKKPEFSNPSVQEKISLVKMYFENDSELLSTWKDIGKKIYFTGEKGIKYGKDFFFKSIENKSGDYKKFEDVLDRVLESFDEQPLTYFKVRHENPFQKIFEQNKILFILLPHELYKFRQLTKQPVIFFNILEERTKYLQSVFRQLQTLIDGTKTILEADTPQASIIDDTTGNSTKLQKAEFTKETSDSVKDNDAINDNHSHVSLFSSICSGLLKRKLAKDFLLPERFLSDFQKMERKKDVFKIIKAFSDSENRQIDLQTAEKIQKNCINSLPQRIYNICALKLLEMSDKTEAVDKSDIQNVIKTNCVWIEYREGYINDISEVSWYFGRLFRHHDRFPENVRTNLQLAVSGWSYFISSALLYLYYDSFI